MISGLPRNSPDNLARLAMALAGGKGRYALLLGSGVSRGAGMPTGWDVAQELLKRYSVATGSAIPADPVSLWRDSIGEEPGYSSILAQIASTPAERQALLEPFWVPTPEERDQQRKVPGAAHTSIAALAKEGVVRIIVTTNFDTLLEQALDNAGVVYSVVANGDDAAGVQPYAHGGVFVVKVSGDYRDTRILNTLAELSGIDGRLEAYVRQIIDDFGLLVCGWSAEWDVGLARLIRAAPNRRYTMWWAHRGTLTDAARSLIHSRDGQQIQIRDADSFFSELQIRVQALIEMGESRLDEPVQAAAVIKLLLKSPSNDIKLREMLMREAEFVRSWALGLDIPQDAVDIRTVAARCEEIAVTTSALRAMLATLTFYGDYTRHGRLVAEALTRLIVKAGVLTGNTAIIDLIEHGVPNLVGDAAALGAFLGDHPDFFRSIYGGTVEVNGSNKSVAIFTAYSGIADNVAVELMGARYYCAITHYERAKAQYLIPILMVDPQDFDERYLQFDYFRSVIIRFITNDAVQLYGEGTRQSRSRRRVEQNRISQGKSWPPIVTGLISNADWVDLTTVRMKIYSNVPGYEKDDQLFS